MYRLVRDGLIIVAAVAAALGFAGILPYGGWTLIASAAVLLAVCLAANYALAKLFGATTNRESATITALILFLILLPAAQITDFAALILAGALAMASKYLLAIHQRHLFNPAAIALVILGLLGSEQVVWWVGSAALLPVVAVIGLLILRKTRRFQLFGVFAAMAIATIAVLEALRGAFTPAVAIEAVVSWPLVFFGTVMLTEPATMPPTHRRRLLYGGLVGLLFGSQFHLGPLSTTPEVALVAGNLFAYLASPTPRWHLRLKDKRLLAPGLYEFIWSARPKPGFQPGQFLEWTLPHAHPDNRGNRRYFTLASSPADTDVRFAVRIDSQRPSSFKAALQRLEPGAELTAAQLAGDFVLPGRPDEKLVFIAGGIGITPFRSMIAHLLDTHQRRDIVLFYAASRPDGFAYRDLLSRAESELGFKVVYILTGATTIPADWSGLTGHLTPGLLRQAVPDLPERICYLSGPPALVQSYRRSLRSAGLSRRRIRTDYFSGY